MAVSNQHGLPVLNWYGWLILTTQHTTTIQELAANIWANSIILELPYLVA